MGKLGCKNVIGYHDIAPQIFGSKLRPNYTEFQSQKFSVNGQRHNESDLKVSLESEIVTFLGGIYSLATVTRALFVMLP